MKNTSWGSWPQNHLSSTVALSYIYSTLFKNTAYCNYAHEWMNLFVTQHCIQPAFYEIRNLIDPACENWIFFTLVFQNGYHSLVPMLFMAFTSHLFCKGAQIPNAEIPFPLLLWKHWWDSVVLQITWCHVGFYGSASDLSIAPGTLLATCARW